jgi:REP element-mobilizing transposase RayT
MLAFEAAAHLGWHDRQRLPHRDVGGVTQAVTFRLADSLPRTVLARWERELELLPRTEADRERRERIDGYLDAGHGECLLRDPRVASLVQDSLRHFDGEHYRLRAWCIMPNHVHVLFDHWEGCPLGKVVWSWKRWTAKRSNSLLGRTGALWQREYHDRFIRDSVHFAAAVKYIEGNPVKARLARHPHEWRWSSAWREK